MTDRELAAIVSGAQVFVMASEAEGFGLPLLESMALGTPVVHSDVPALVEVAAGAGVPIPRSGPREARAESIADAIRSILSDDDAARSLRQLGLDRWPSYSWRDSAEKVWQLHADL
ncbi:glycosyltransferase [Microcella daejeonensis]|nr:glycosyltransferase [Microcella daejeonensis]